VLFFPFGRIRVHDQSGAGVSADSGVRMSTLWRRSFSQNRFSGTVPPTISALTALTYLCAPFTRPGSAPTWRMRRCASTAAARGRFIFGAAVCFTVRDQVLGPERFDRPDLGEHRGAHQAGYVVRPHRRVEPRSVG
jgi:hypothetical protein